ncbi:MAG: 3-deoxy-manno-octulosonate cytidylyltransferase [Bacteroidales bacterium]
MKILAIIPSRYASTRFPAKPLINIKGKTMIQRVYLQAKKATNYCCVATDNIEIYNNVKKIGGEAIMTSTEHNSGTDRCMEAYTKYCKLHSNVIFDVVINVQGDEPLINPEQLNILASAFKDGKVQIASMTKLIDTNEELFDNSIPKVLVDNDSNALIFSRECLPYIRNVEKNEWLGKFPYRKHIGIYAYRPEMLKKICELKSSSLEKVENLEQLRWLENGLKIKMIDTKFETISIDSPQDLKTLINYMEKKNIQ